MSLFRHVLCPLYVGLKFGLTAIIKWFGAKQGNFMKCKSICVATGFTESLQMIW